MGAELYRYNATGSADALVQARHYYSGMRLLNDVTGIPGLMARSCIPPNVSAPQDVRGSLLAVYELASCVDL